LGAARTVVVGDIHGCYDELLALIELVGLGERDRLVCVGDLVVKGEKSREVLELFMSDARFSSVLGNHDRALLQAWKGEREDLKPSQQRCRAQLDAGRERYTAFLASLPLFIDLGTHVVVHAGLRPNVALAEQSAEDLTELRTLGPDRTSREGTPWYEVYRGERVALFGHWPMTPPRRGPRAIGLDTGCVYGYSLTAYVVETGEFFSVPARRAYEEPRGRVENENG
jgi:predicted phosphodiesterase